MISTPRQHGILRANPATPAEQLTSSRYGRINMACPTPLVQHLSVLSIRTRLLRYVHITVVVLSKFHITVLALRYLCNMSRCCKKSAFFVPLRNIHIIVAVLSDIDNIVAMMSDIGIKIRYCQ